MYSLAEKNRVIQLFKEKYSIESIRLKSNISKSTLYRWKAQYEKAKEKSKQVKEYINEGKLDEAENLAKEILKSSPNDLAARGQLITIYTEQEKWDEVERLAKEKLKLDPSNLPTRSQLITACKKQEKWDEVERLAKERLELNPSDLPARSQLIVIYKKQEKWDEVERLTREILELDPSDLIAKRQLGSIPQKREDQRTSRVPKVENQDKNKETNVTNSSLANIIQAFRKKVYDGEITIENLSDYEKQLASLPPFEQKMLLAEAYVHWNMATNATKILKEASSAENISERQQKILKQAMQISKSKNSNPIARRKQWSILNGNGEGR